MKNIQNNYVVIMAGGIGTRFWPFSRTNNPKQFHDILGTGKTLIQQTVARFEGVCLPENIFIVSHKDYKNIIQEQLPFITDNQLLLEPARKNTAPCVAYACYKISQINPNANIIVAPSDHIILKEDEFKKIALQALQSAETKDILITLGIKPSRPDTGYGYIQYDNKRGLKNLMGLLSSPLKKVKMFTEKPPLEMAEAFLKSGDYLWNGGIFIWSAKTIIKAMEKYAPELAEVFTDIKHQFGTPDEENAVESVYSMCKSDSIDYAIMEKADNVYVIPVDFGWSDLGTWKSLYEISQKDEAQNVVSGHSILENTTNCIIRTHKDKLVVVSNLDGFIVSEYDNVLMICKKEDEQKVKDFVAEAKKKGKEFI